MTFSVYYSKTLSIPENFEDTIDSVDLRGQLFVMSAIRNYRDSLLKDSDWTQSTDSILSEASKELWSIYRQQLRDFTNTINFTTSFKLTDSDFPVKPE